MLRALVRSLSTEATKAAKAPFVLEVTAIPTQLAIEKGFATWFNHHVQQVADHPGMQSPPSLWTPLAGPSSDPPQRMFVAHIGAESIDALLSFQKSEVMAEMKTFAMMKFGADGFKATARILSAAPLLPGLTKTTEEKK